MNTIGNVILARGPTRIAGRVRQVQVPAVVIGPYGLRDWVTIDVLLRAQFPEESKRVYGLLNSRTDFDELVSELTRADVDFERTVMTVEIPDWDFEDHRALEGILSDPSAERVSPLIEKVLCAKCTWMDADHERRLATTQLTSLILDRFRTIVFWQPFPPEHLLRLSRG